MLTKGGHDEHLFIYNGLIIILPEILGSMCIVMICFPVEGIINFRI